jgi:hypothetical protein
MSFAFTKNIEVIQPGHLYKWAKIWGKVQKRYYKDQVHLRREKQITDFITLNEYKNIYIEKDTDVLEKLSTVDEISLADLVVITDQKFSRMPCTGIIERIQQILEQCPRLYLCLNRHYINIDNSFCDLTLDDNINLAITQWLKKNLPNVKLLDLSLDYLDRGDWFTWVVPDRMYYIEKLCD